MKDLHTSLDRGQECFLLVAFSKSQKALNPELYFAQVERATAELSSSENCPWTEAGLVCPMEAPASGIF
jgi:hypothetical protein